MAKLDRHSFKDRFSLNDFEMRPVQKNDKWCYKKLNNGEIPPGKAPWGYVVTIPFIPNKNTFLEYDESFIIIRCKKHCGNFLLQVIFKDESPRYGVKSFSRLEPYTKKMKRKNKHKQYRVLNIRNFQKSEGKW